eukprot:10281662-Karenia_brevis.AAC.2
MQATEQTNLSAEHFLQKLASWNTFSGLTKDAADSVLKKLQNRDTQPLIEIYMSADAGAEGTAMLEKLRDNIKKVAGAKDLLTAWNLKSQSPFVYWKALDAAKKILTIPSGDMLESIVSMEIQQSFSKKEWGSCRGQLQIDQSKDADYTDISEDTLFTVQHLPMLRREEIQKKYLGPRV